MTNTSAPLVERLRCFVACEGGDLADIEKAADELDRLREENARLLAALQGMMKGAYHDCAAVRARRASANAAIDAAMKGKP